MITYGLPAWAGTQTRTRGLKVPCSAAELWARERDRSGMRVSVRPPAPPRRTIAHRRGCQRGCQSTADVQGHTATRHTSARGTAPTALPPVLGRRPRASLWRGLACVGGHARRADHRDRREPTRCHVRRTRALRKGSARAARQHGATSATTEVTAEAISPPVALQGDPFRANER